MTASQAGRPLWWVAGLVLLLAVGGLAYSLAEGPESAVLPAPSPTSDGAPGREAAAADVLADLVAALESGDRAAARALAAPSRISRTEVVQLVANARDLGITDLEARYLDENAGRSVTALPGRLRDRAWVADVEISWRIDDHEEEVSTLEVAMAFLETDDGAAFVSARGSWGRPAPLWLLDRLSIAESRRTLVMAAGGPERADRYARMAKTAVRDVAKVLPEWRGSVVVAVPRSEDDLGRLLPSRTSYTAIAAVTAPADGSLDPEAPHHIYLNPAVFDPLGKQGAQIVMSHEAAHVATDAAISTMPTWLLEGFADYVALAYVDLPVQVTASQILAQVRRGGPPEELPTEQDFASENRHLGASYEAAWLACRLIAREYGEDRLIELYEQADRDGDTAAAFREVLGTTERVVTRAWRAELQELAGR